MRERGKHWLRGSEHAKRWASGWAALTACLALSAQGFAAPTVKMTEPLLVEATPTMVPSTGSFPELAQGSDGLLLLYADVVKPIPLSRSTAGEDQGVVVAQLLSASGEPVGEPFDVAARGRPLGATFDGNDYLVSWFESAGVGDEHCYFQRISSDGQLVGTAVEVPDVRVLRMVGGTDGKTLVTTCSGIQGQFCKARLLVGSTLSAGVQLPFIHGARVSYSAAEDLWLAWEGTQFVLMEEDGLLNDEIAVVLESSAPGGVALATPGPTGFVAARSATEGSYDSIELLTIGFDGSLSTPVTVVSVFQTDGPWVDLTGLQSTPDGLLVFYDYSWDDQCQLSTCLPAVEPKLAKLDHELTPAGVMDIQSWSGPVATAPSYYVIADPHMMSGGNIGADLTVGQPLPLAERPARQHPPLGAPGPSGWLVAWTEEYPSQQDRRGLGVRACLLSEGGSLIQAPDLLKDSDQLRALRHGPGGWLMATNPPQYPGDNERGSIWFLPHENPFAPETAIDWYGHVEIASSPSSWLVVNASPLQLRMRRRVVDQAWEPPVTLAQLDSGGGFRFSGVMDVTFDGQRYVVTWLEEHRVLAVRIPVEGELGALLPEILAQNLSQPAVQGLEAAFLADSWWLLATSSAGSTWVTNGDVTTHANFGGGSLSLVDTSLLGARSSTQTPGAFELLTAFAGEVPTIAVSGEGLSALDISDASDNHALLAGLVETSNYGRRPTRVVTRVLELDAGLGEGGSGGDAGFGGDAGSGASAGTPGEPEPSEAGAPTNGGTAAGGSGGVNAAGHAAGDSSRDDDADLPSSNEGCGCRFPGSAPSSSTSLLLLIGALLVRVARRRRHSPF